MKTTIRLSAEALLDPLMMKTTKLMRTTMFKWKRLCKDSLTLTESSVKILPRMMMTKRMKKKLKRKNPRILMKMMMETRPTPHSLTPLQMLELKFKRLN
jgi:hypothetical protein